MEQLTDETFSNIHKYILLSGQVQLYEAFMKLRTITIMLSMILSGNEPQLLSNSGHLLGNLKEPVPAQTVEENNLPLITAYMWTTLKENVD